ncbi:peptidyl-tRNA hydrolase domain protein, partial [Coniochaeta sp. 2T2.1]
FSTSATHAKKAMPPRPKPPPEDDIEECFIHGSGPGGQKINKTASAVQLKHIPTGLVVKSQATRSREQNRKIARELLAAKLDVMANGEQSRTIIIGNYKKKRADSAAKKARRKYRKLEEEKVGAKEGDGVE